MKQDSHEEEDFAINPLHLQIKLTNPTYNKNISSKLKINDDVDDYLKGYELYTRDLRLGNLSPNELNIARAFLSYSGDLFSMGEEFIPPALSSLRRVADIIELSHSKRGWARKLLGTFRREEFRRDELSDERGSIFSKKRNQEA